MSSVVYTIILVAVAIAVAAVAVGLWYLAADLWLGPLARRLRAARSLGPTRSKLADLLRRNAVVRTDAAPRFWASVVSMPGRRLRGLLEQAHWRRTPGQIVLWSVACGFVGLAGGTLAGLSRPAAAALALGAAALPTAWLVLSCRRRLRRVEQQMPSALDALVNSLQCGHTLQESLRGAVDATAEPLREDLAAILQSVDLGAPWDDALDAFARRVPTKAAAVLASAMRMHCRLGSDVSKVMQMVSQMARERLELAQQVKSLSAEIRLSGAVLIALPWIAFGAVYLTAHDYVMSLFHDEFGRRLATAAVVLQIVGALVIRSIVKVQR